MIWTTATFWWLAAGGLVIAELLSGSFYLLMLALGTAAGAVAAQAGLALEGGLELEKVMESVRAWLGEQDVLGLVAEEEAKKKLEEKDA